jgi:hypothetical protein
VERDENGRFVKGNKGGPGRPKKTREERYLEITLNAVTFADWQEIVKRAAMDAKRGDSTARKWLADYLVGTPVQKQEFVGIVNNDYELDADMLRQRVQNIIEKYGNDDDSE